MLDGECRVEIMDVKRHEVAGVDVLHLCYPWLTVATLESYAVDVETFSPRYTVIHATVKPGTTDSLALMVDGPVVHSPVMGKHPHLGRDMQMYTKFVASRDGSARKECAGTLEDCGVRTYIMKDPRVTELGKLLSTTRFGIILAVAQATQRLLDGMDRAPEYSDVVLQFLEVYNTGLRETGRSYLEQPMVLPGRVGGHCVVQNYRILREWAGEQKHGYWFVELLDFVERLNGEFTEEVEEASW